MVCNKCGKQMKQYKDIGGGSMSPSNYNTWEVKHCPECDDYVLEEYNAIKVTLEEIEMYESVRHNRIDDILLRKGKGKYSHLGVDGDGVVKKIHAD